MGELSARGSISSFDYGCCGDLPSLACPISYPPFQEFGTAEQQNFQILPPQTLLGINAFEFWLFGVASLAFPAHPQPANPSNLPRTLHELNAPHTFIQSQTTPQHHYLSVRLCELW
jgi:hypothetical protein